MNICFFFCYSVCLPYYLFRNYSQSYKHNLILKQSQLKVHSLPYVTRKSKNFTNRCKSLQNEFLCKEFWFSNINLPLKSVFLQMNGVSTHFQGSDNSSLCKLSCWGKALFKPWTTILKFLIQALIDVYDVSIAYGPIQSFMNRSLSNTNIINPEQPY